VFRNEINNLRIQKKTGRFFAPNGANTFKNKQSSFPALVMKPYSGGVSDEAPVCGHLGGLLVAAIVEVLFVAGAVGAANLRWPKGGAA